MLEAVDNCEKRLQMARARVNQLAIATTNRKSILDFGDYCLSDGLSTGRVLKYLSALSNIARRLQKDFYKTTRADIQLLVQGIERSNYSDWTKRDYRVTLKKFYRWLRETEEYPPEVKWLRSGIPNNRKRLPESLLTQDEVRRLITASDSSRDKALIAALYESGCRIGELLSLRIGQIQRQIHGFQITLKGGKGSRRLLLIASMPHFTAWLNEHPKGEDPSAFLWITADYRTRPLSYERTNRILKRLAKRAGISKPVNPHNFRHSRATHLAVHLTEAQMKEYFGWTQGSDMASTYVHLSGRDLDNTLLKLNNIEIPDKGKDQELFSLQNCPTCKLNNPPNNKFCSRCGTVLDEKKAKDLIEQQLERQQAEDFMSRLIQDEEFQAFVDRKLKETVTIKS